MKKQSSYKWMKELGIAEYDILDPDGWDRSRLHYSYSRAITEKTFTWRLACSTIIMGNIAKTLFEKHGL